MAKTLKRSFRNPYIAGAPVKGADMFFGRNDIFDRIRAHLIGRHQDNAVVIFGQRRTGKTSILYQMGRRLGAYEVPYAAILVDLQGFELKGMNRFISELAEEIQHTLLRDHELDIHFDQWDAFGRDPWANFRNMFLPSVQEALANRRLLLMFDETVRLDEAVATQQLEGSVFDYLRNLMQHQYGLSFIFSLGSKLERMRSEYSLMFNPALHLPVSFLDRAAARDLVTRPVKELYTFEDDAVEHLLELTSCHPYYTQLMCHNLFTHCQPHGVERVFIAHVDEVVPTAISLASNNIRYIWNESSRAEKLVMAALAEIVPGSATIDDVDCHLKQKGGHLERTELIGALQSLASREIIGSPAHSLYTVELVRRWVNQEQPLEWVVEQLRGPETPALPADSGEVIPNVEFTSEQSGAPTAPWVRSLWVGAWIFLAVVALAAVGGLLISGVSPIASLKTWLSGLGQAPASILASTPGPTAAPETIVTSSLTPTETPTSTPTPPPTPTPSPSPDSITPTASPTVGATSSIPSLPPYCTKIGSAFDDDFSDPNSGWTTPSGEKSAGEYYEGEYRIALSEGRVVEVAYRPDCYYYFDMQVDVRRESELASGGYASIRFAYIGETYYELDIHTTDQPGVVLWHRPAGPMEQLTEHLGASAIKPGDESNRVRLLLENNELSIFLNDEFVDTVGIEGTKWGHIALRACTCDVDAGSAYFYFDNFSIRSLP